MKHRLAVLGQPVAHSRSPAMQNAALAELGLVPGWSYEAIEVDAEVFEELVRGMAERGFAGANVTVPHKAAALAVSDEASDTARAIGAANTLTFADGAIQAENTDAPGLLAALPEPPRGRALVLGAGGAARAVVWALVGTGAEVGVWNRTPERAEALCADIGGAPDPDPDAAAYDLVVNASAVGLGGEDPLEALPLREDSFRPGQVVVDMVYGADPTSLLELASTGGADTVDGLEILVRQGAASLELWTGCDAPLDAMRAGARDG